MPKRDYEEEARRRITGRCLIATDVDKTILCQSDNRNQEKLDFFRQVAPPLVEAARLGTNIAFLTGNSMDQMCSRVLTWLVEQLCLTDDLDLIARFHFFCSSGGVYFHFDPGHADLQPAFKRGVKGRRQKKKFLNAISEKSDDGKHFVLPQFVEPGYIQRCMIEPEEIAGIREILERAADAYMANLKKRQKKYRRDYDLRWIRDDNRFIRPEPELRTTSYGSPGSGLKATVQITLKPVLSFRQGKDDEHCEKLFGNDVRSKVIEEIQANLDSAGLSRYVARPGGRGSIDITLQKLDKAYALEALIDRLELQGNPRDGQEFGSNAIYFGDEVIVGGGNDYPVVRIPGLLVLAVNLERQLVPFLHGVFVPSTVFQGPKATASILTQFNNCASQLLIEYRDKLREYRKKLKIASDVDPPQPPSTRTAIEEFRIELFSDRIKKKLNRMERNPATRVNDWQTLHTFTTLLGRNDATARQCLGILIKTLDGMMEQLADRQPAAGSSHEDHLPGL